VFTVRSLLILLVAVAALLAVSILSCSQPTASWCGSDWEETSLAERISIAKTLIEADAVPRFQDCLVGKVADIVQKTEENCSKPPFKFAESGETAKNWGDAMANAISFHSVVCLAEMAGR
jgi:hypothetical protein